MIQTPESGGIVDMLPEDRRKLEEALAEGLAPQPLSGDQEAVLKTRLAQLENGGIFSTWTVVQQNLNVPSDEAGVRDAELLESAEADLRTLRDAFDAERPGLGQTFLGQIDQELGRIVENPVLADLVVGGLLRVGLLSFPYSVVYRMQDGRVQVVAVMRHARRMDSSP